MESTIKKAFYLGVCAAAVTKRFIDAEVKRYLEAGHISEEEGKKIVKNAVKQLKKDRATFEKALRKEIKLGMKEAKPLIHESRQLVKELANELVREAKSAVKTRAKTAVRRVKKVRKVAAKAAGVAKRLRARVKRVVTRKPVKAKKAAKAAKRRKKR